jgi:molybdopterin-guanine dinucleotide biosynthesis adapter protein
VEAFPSLNRPGEGRLTAFRFYTTITLMKIFTIAGWSGSGKTLLITRLIEKFKARNRKVVAVKHAPEIDLVQPVGKDSRRFLESGADQSLLVTRNELAVFLPLTDRDDRFSLLKTAFQGADIVLMEGFYTERVPIIEVVNIRHNPTLRLPVARLAAIVSDSPLQQPVPCFLISDVDPIADFLEEYDEKHHSA